MPTLRALSVLLLLAACGSSVGGASGRWIGLLTAAPPNPDCPATTGVAQIKDGHLVFTPDEGTWVLTGIATQDGTVAAERVRPGANKQPYVTSLSGTWTPTTLTGTYTTPRCTFTVQLVHR